MRLNGCAIAASPAYTESALRLELSGGEIERLTRFDPLTGHKLADLPDVTIFPGKQTFKTRQAKLRLGPRMTPEG